MKDPPRSRAGYRTSGRGRGRGREIEIEVEQVYVQRTARRRRRRPPHPHPPEWGREGEVSSAIDSDSSPLSTTSDSPRRSTPPRLRLRPRPRRTARRAQHSQQPLSRSRRCLSRGGSRAGRSRMSARGWRAWICARRSVAGGGCAFGLVSALRRRRHSSIGVGEGEWCWWA